MKHFSIRSLLIVVFALAFSFTNHAQVYGAGKQEGVGPFIQLGEQLLSFPGEENYIPVESQSIYYKLKFKSLDEPVELVSIKVAFTNGTHENIFLGFVLDRARESREIELKMGSARKLKGVHISYKSTTTGFQGATRIVLMGQKLKTSPN